MNQRISNAKKGDIESLMKIYSSPDLYHSRKEASWFIKSYLNYHHIKVIRHGHRIIGAIFWNSVEEKHHGIANVQDLWVDNSFRRKGLGEKLLRSAIEDMKELYSDNHYSLRKILVTTGENNKPARNLYEKVGFRMTAALPDLFALGENELVYILTLNP